MALLVAAVALALVVKAHPGPLPDDVPLELADQRLLLPHHLLATALDQVSRVNWPTPAGIVVGTVFALLLRRRRWLDALTPAGASIFGDLTSYLTNQIVQRPRPAGHGIVILQQITSYFGFPSGHVMHVVAFFGMLLFLTCQIRRWLLRLGVLLPLLLSGPSRLMEGERWPSDVLEGVLVGACWLLLAPDEPASPATRRRGCHSLCYVASFFARSLAQRTPSHSVDVLDTDARRLHSDAPSNHTRGRILDAVTKRVFEAPPLVRQKSAHLGDLGGQWLAGLPTLSEELERRWSITVDEPVTAGTAAFVARVHTADGQAAVLKLAVPDPDFANQVRTLHLAQGQKGTCACSPTTSSGMRRSWRRSLRQ